MKNAALTLILVALVVVLVVFAATTVECQALEDLESIRWAAMSMVNVAVAGTDQVTKAFVDSMIIIAVQTVGTDFALSSYMTNTDTQYVTATITTADLDRTQFYTMNSDFIPGGLTTVMRKAYDAKGFYLISATKPPVSASKPGETNDPTYAWTEGHVLIIQPAPRLVDTFFLTYRVLPIRMTGDASLIDIDPPLRRMVVVLAAADIAKRLNLTGREAMLRSEYAAFKNERLVLPAAALSGGNQ